MPVTCCCNERLNHNSLYAHVTAFELFGIPEMLLSSFIGTTFTQSHTPTLRYPFGNSIHYLDDDNSGEITGLFC